MFGFLGMLFGNSFGSVGNHAGNNVGNNTDHNAGDDAGNNAVNNAGNNAAYKKCFSQLAFPFVFYVCRLFFHIFCLTKLSCTHQAHKNVSKSGGKKSTDFAPLRFSKLKLFGHT